MKASSFSLTGRHSGFGNFFYGMESNLEDEMFLVAEVDPDIAWQRVQITRSYWDAEGRLRDHTFDQVKGTHHGVTVFEAAKPKALQESSGIHAVIAAFRAQSNDPNVFFQVVDEDHLPAWRVANAKLTRKALDEPDSDADDRLFEVLSDAKASITILEAGRRAGLGNRALQAAARLIRTKEVVLVDGPLIEIRSAIAIAER